MHYTAVDNTHSLHTHTTPTHVIKSVPQDFDHRLYYSTRESRNSNPPVSSPCLTWELPRESTEFDQSGHIPTQYYSNWLIFISGISDSNKPCVSHIMDNVLIMHYTAVDITHSLHTHTTPTHVIKSVPQDFDHRLYYSTRESRNSNPPVSSPCLTWELPRESTEFDQSGHIPTQYYSNWLIFISGISDSNKPCVSHIMDNVLIMHYTAVDITHSLHTHRDRERTA
eukprot:sb/3469657/